MEPCHGAALIPAPGEAIPWDAQSSPWAPTGTCRGFPPALPWYQRAPGGISHGKHELNPNWIPRDPLAASSVIPRSPSWLIACPSIPSASLHPRSKPYKCLCVSASPPHPGAIPQSCSMVLPTSRWASHVWPFQVHSLFCCVCFDGFFSPPPSSFL